LVPAVLTARSRPEPPAARPAAAHKEEAVVPETQDAEFVSLEDADAEAQGRRRGGGRRAKRISRSTRASTMPPSSESRKRPTMTSPISLASVRDDEEPETGRPGG